MALHHGDGGVAGCSVTRSERRWAGVGWLAAHPVETVEQWTLDRTAGLPDRLDTAPFSSWDQRTKGLTAHQGGGRDRVRVLSSETGLCAVNNGGASSGQAGQKGPRGLLLAASASERELSGRSISPFRMDLT